MQGAYSRYIVPKNENFFYTKEVSNHTLKNSVSLKAVEATEAFLRAVSENFVYIKIFGNRVIKFSEFNGADKTNAWLKNMFELVCANRFVENCEFFVNNTNLPLLSKDNDAAQNLHAVFSFKTSDSFRDLVLPAFSDYDRINDKIFGIVNFNHIKWDDKNDDVFLLQKLSDKDEIIYEDLQEACLHKYIVWDDNVDDNKLSHKIISKLFFTGSCIIRLKSEYKYWFDPLFEKNVHYVEAEDAMSLREIFEKIKRDDSAFKKIGNACRFFACKYLSSNYVLDFVANALETVGTRRLSYNMHQLEIERFLLGQIGENCLNPSVPSVNVSKISVNAKTEKITWSSCVAISMLFSNTNAQELSSTLCDFVQEHRVDFEYSQTLLFVNDLFTSFFCINALYKFVPNFLYTFFYTSNANGAFRIYSERPYNLSNIGQFVKDAPKKALYEIYIQICLALQVAYETCFFLHGNLSEFNVYVKVLNKPTNLIYTLRNNSFVLNTRYVVIFTDFSQSFFVSDIFNKDNLLLFGKMDTEIKENVDIDVILHAKGGKNIKYFLKKIFGQRLGNKFYETMLNVAELDEPKSFINKVVDGNDLSLENVNFQKLETVPEPEPENVRLRYDKILNNPNPHSSVGERIYQNTLPISDSKFNNAVLQYEIVQNIKSALLDLNMKFSVDVVASKYLERMLVFVNEFYKNAMDESTNTIYGNKDKRIVRYYMSKYILQLKNSPFFKMFYENLKDVLAITTKEVIQFALKNSQDFLDAK